MLTNFELKARKYHDVYPNSKVPGKMNKHKAVLEAPGT